MDRSHYGDDGESLTGAIVNMAGANGFCRGEPRRGDMFIGARK